MTYIIDLDNTLVFTDELNNSSYNYALSKKGYVAIENEQRITREVLCRHYPEIDRIALDGIINEKQYYFISHLEQTKVNERLLKYLLESKHSWIIWTSADRIRADAIVRFYDFQEYAKVFYTTKVSPKEDITGICKEIGIESRDCIVIEDDERIIQSLKEAKITVKHLKSLQLMAK